MNRSNLAHYAEEIPTISEYIESRKLDGGLRISQFPIPTYNYMYKEYYDDIINQIRISIHKCILTIYGKEAEGKVFLKKFQKKFQGVERDTDREKDKRYRKVNSCREGAKELQLRYDSVKGYRYPFICSVSFSSPTASFLQSLHNLTIESNLDYSIYSLEIPIDFHTHHYEELRYILENSCVLKYSRSVFWIDAKEIVHRKWRNGATFYTRSRKSSQQVKIYKRETSVPGIYKVRVELTVRKRRLRKMDIRQIPDLYYAQVSALLKHLSFCDFDWNRFEDVAQNPYRDSKYPKKMNALLHRRLDNPKEYHLTNGLAACLINGWGFPKKDIWPFDSKTRFLKSNELDRKMQSLIVGKIVGDILKP